MGCAASQQVAPAEHAETKTQQHEAKAPAVDQAPPAKTQEVKESQPSPAGKGQVHAAVADEEDADAELDANEKPDVWKAESEKVDWSTLGKLRVKKCGLTEIPPQALSSPLVELEIGENAITSLADLERLPKLKFLDATGSQRESLTFSHDALATMPVLPRLEKLHLYGNGISDVPEIVFAQTTVKDLNLCNNKLLKLSPSIAKLTRLEELNLSSNKLMQLPAGVLDALGQLKVLKLHMNRIVRLPDLSPLVHLEELHLQSNSLLEMPKFGNHPHLKEINVTKNQLKSLGEGFARAHVPALEVLEADTNQLESVPATLGELGHLRKLNVNNNAIKELPAGLFASGSLVTLMVEGNQLTAVPNEIAKLKGLTNFLMQSNKITALPGSLADATQLTKVTLKGNPLPAGDPTVAKMEEIVNAKGANKRWVGP